MMWPRLLFLFFFCTRLVIGQNFQWSGGSSSNNNNNDETRPWPFGSGAPQFGAGGQNQQNQQSQQQQQQPQQFFVVQGSQTGQGQLVVQSKQPWQAVPAPDQQGRPGGPGGSGQQQQPVFLVPSGSIGQGGSGQQLVWTSAGGSGQVPGQLQTGQVLVPVQVQPGQIWQPGNSGSQGGSGGVHGNAQGSGQFQIGGQGQIQPNNQGGISANVGLSGGANLGIQGTGSQGSSGGHQGVLHGSIGQQPVQVQGQPATFQQLGGPSSTGGNGQFIVVGSNPSSNQVWAAAGANQRPPTNQWFGDPNRAPDAQNMANQPIGASIHTTADKTVVGVGFGGNSWNGNSQQQPPPAGWAGNNQQQWPPPAGQAPVWGQPGAPPPPGAVNPNQGSQAWWQQQQQQQIPPAGWSGWQQPPQNQPPPLWVPGQQGWVTNPPPFVPTPIPIAFFSTTPSSMEDHTNEILRDLVAYHMGGTFPRDEVRQYNAKVPMPRQHRDYWLGEIYYNLDPVSQIPGKIKCVYSLPQSMSRLHYDDGNPVGVVVFQCVQFQERCCNLDCCNLAARTPSPQEQRNQQQNWPRYPWGGAQSTRNHCLTLWLSLTVSLLVILHARLKLS